MRAWLGSSVAALGVGLLVWPGAPPAFRAGAGLLSLAGLLLALAACLYTPPVHTAWLRCHGDDTDVILDRTALILPWQARPHPVSLAALILRVGALGDAPLRLADGSLVEVEVHAFAQVPPEEASIRRAREAFGEHAGTPLTLARAAEVLLAGAVRERLTSQSWPILDRRRAYLGDQLQQHLTPLLRENGMRLERVLLVHLQPLEDETAASNGRPGVSRQGGAR